MIDGITILAQETVIPSTIDIVAVFVFAGLFLILGVISLIICIINRETVATIISIVILLSALILGVVGSSVASQEPYTRYKVLIDQNVPWSTFYSNYEIIDQEGQIYTIKEK